MFPEAEKYRSSIEVQRMDTIGTNTLWTPQFKFALLKRLEDRILPRVRRDRALAAKLGGRALLDVMYVDRKPELVVGVIDPAHPWEPYTSSKWAFLEAYPEARFYEHFIALQALDSSDWPEQQKAQR